MTFLPIVQRELRAAARKRSTYRARMGFALATSLVAAILILVESPATARTRGSSVFPILSALAFCACLLAGIRQAADCLSEEKREGTLGLLFLTDLRGYDVVAGKLASISVKTFQGLLALFPVLAIGLVLGGITPGEFWRMILVLTSTLFISLSAGLWVSAQSRAAHRALTATIGLLGLLLVVPFVIGRVLPHPFFGGTGQFVSYLSPITAAHRAWDLSYRTDPASYWLALWVSHLLGWGFFLLASLTIPHSWQDRPVLARANSAFPGGRLKASPARARTRARLLDANPILWLASRNEGQRVLLAIFGVTCAIGGFVVLVLSHWLEGFTFGIATGLNLVLTLVLKFWVAWQACATLAEARRSGAVELLLATPLKTDEIIRGHWQALQRFFAWPVAAALLVRVIPSVAMLLMNPGAGGREQWILFSAGASTVFSLVTLAFDLIAIAWVGMWMGISQPKPIQAFGRTILFAVIIPAVVFCLPNILFDFLWIQWARRKLESEFRKAAVDRFAPVEPFGAYRTELAPVPAPPIIRS